jgi:DNA modification methylase
MTEADTDFDTKDYTNVYQRIMQFDKNKAAFIHQWYPFVEGYSKDFINSILSELDYLPKLALDPFAGSGTTPLELQSRNISCISYEVSPFMHLLATVKLEQDYKACEFQAAMNIVESTLNTDLTNIRERISIPGAKTFQKNDKLKKWIFNDDVLNGLLDIKYSISIINHQIYQKLFKVALGSILLEVSNVYRDGKSVKYKTNWKDKIITRQEVHDKFIAKLRNIILPDIIELEQIDYSVSNKNICHFGDVRKCLEALEDESVDLVITSPPYLNSRDYTDIYIVELWMLDLIHDYDELKILRGNTFRSHVQIKHGIVELIDSPELKNVISRLTNITTNHWNKELPNMVKGYFKDMEILFCILKRKMKPGKKVYFNVANSAYYGIEIEVDRIIAKIAQDQGFQVNEIRTARNLKPSSQQKDLVRSLRETVIVLTS